MKRKKFSKFSTVDLNALWSAVVEGNVDAFEELYARMYGKIKNLLYWYFRDYRDIEEVIDDTLYNVWTFRSSINITSSLEGYILRIARNEACRRLNKKKKYQFILTDFSEHPCHTHSSTKTIHSDFANTLLQDLVDTEKKYYDKLKVLLSDLQYDVFLLAELGLKPRDILQSLTHKTTIGSVRNALCKAKAKLAGNAEITRLAARMNQLRASLPEAY